jgi:hypothetical protein
MPQPSSPFQQQVPTLRRTLISVGIAMLLAAVVLVCAVLPVEYGLDPTGVGQRLGLTQMHAAPGKKIDLGETAKTSVDFNTAQPPAVGEPLPLPNPAVHQAQTAPAKSETLTVTLPVDGEIEIKAVLAKDKVMLYSWQVDRGQVYVDFHGHDPQWQDQQAFVRYQEKDGITNASGSLVAPFTGEHGWYWLNTSEFPVVITLTVNGYYDKLINYGAKVQGT